jgi:uncharacterized membrane protein
MENKPVKTALGLEENIESALCYAGIWVTGILFFLLEKDNKNVRFHALQSLIVFLGLSVLTYIIGRFSFFGYLLWLATILLWILLMVKAYQGERFKLPRIGDFVENMIGSTPSAAPSGSQTQADTQQPPTNAAEKADTAAQAASPSGPDKEILLKAVEQALSHYPQFAVTRSSQTDLEIKSIPGAAKEQPGAKKVEYKACLLAKEAERLVFYWEMMKESGIAQDFQLQEKSFEAERNGLNGRKAAGESLDYERTRGIIENAVKSSGWAFKTVLGKSKAMYPK